MTLMSSKYGKSHVRVMRIHRDGELHQVRELSVQTILQGSFTQAYTDADNRGVIATDTIKNIVNIVAREQVAAGREEFCHALAHFLLDRYASVEQVEVTVHETAWKRITIDGVPHPHGFVLDGNGTPTAQLIATRGERHLSSGIDGLTFLKSTGSGWTNFLRDSLTTLPETEDRIAATSMNALWRWSSTPPDYEAACALLLQTMLKVFVTTYSHSVQDSLYRMGEAALAAVPEVADIHLACPNKHYLPIDLSKFGKSADNLVFTPTDEPHGQIECHVGR